MTQESKPEGAKLSPELAEFLKKKANKVINNASLAATAFAFNRSSDTDVWCTLAYMTGSLKGMGLHTNNTTRFPSGLWEAFEKIGLEHAAIISTKKEKPQ